MADVLIRDVPDEVLDHLDADARQAGISRSEYIRRLLATAATSHATVTREDLERFARTFADLANPDVIREAWS